MPPDKPRRTVREKFEIKPDSHGERSEKRSLPGSGVQDLAKQVSADIYFGDPGCHYQRCFLVDIAKVLKKM